TVNIVEVTNMLVFTCISGSGPAYMYYLVEAIEEAVIKQGLDQVTAKALITHSVIGSCMMLKTSELPVDVLREYVTSPNGTTEAGINKLSEHHFKESIINCVNAATNRSKELGKEENK